MRNVKTKPILTFPATPGFYNMLIREKIDFEVWRTKRIAEHNAKLAEYDEYLKNKVCQWGYIVEFAPKHTEHYIRSHCFDGAVFDSETEAKTYLSKNVNRIEDYTVSHVFV